MKIPCPSCNPCPDPNDPFQNFSAEAPDVDHVFCYGSGNGGLLPGAGRNWNVDNCTITWGPVSCYGTEEEECLACVESFHWTCQPNQFLPFPDYPIPPNFPPDDYPDEEDTISPIIEPDPDNPDGPGIPRVIYWNTEQVAYGICPDGSVGSIFKVVAHRFAAYSQAEADLKAATYAINRAQRTIICMGLTNSNACTDVPYGGTVFVTGPIRSAVVFSVASGSLPPGVELSDTSPNTPRYALLSGTPTEAGSFTFTILGTADPNISVSKEFTINVLGASNATTLPEALTGVDYATIPGSQLMGTGGTAPFVFTADPAALPNWLTVGTDGTLSGTPAVGDAGIQFLFEVTVTDDEGRECVQRCSIDVVQSCVADTACPALNQIFYSCVLPPTLTISDWNTRKLELIAPTANPAAGQPEWDGTLPVQDTVLFPGFSYWVPAGSAIGGPWTDFAFNGIFSDANYIQATNGATPFILRLRGKVGAVAQVVWEGNKTVGENPIGTYMRTGGLSAGPDCFHVTGPTTPHALAWWEMEANATAVVDSACGLILDGSFNPALHSIVAGHVNNALRLHPFGFASVTSECASANLSLADSGVTIVGWVQATFNVSDAGNNVAVRYSFFNGATEHILRARAFEGGLWTAELDGLGLINKAFAAGWHFLVLQYNPTTGVLGFDIDQSGITNVNVGSFFGTTSASSRFFLISVTDAALADMFGDFDEFAIYNGILSTTQLDCIYNGGAGRTW